MKRLASLGVLHFVLYILFIPTITAIIPSMLWVSGWAQAQDQSSDGELSEDDSVGDTMDEAMDEAMEDDVTTPSTWPTKENINRPFFPEQTDDSISSDEGQKTSEEKSSRSHSKKASRTKITTTASSRHHDAFSNIKFKRDKKHFPRGSDEYIHSDSEESIDKLKDEL